MGFMRPNKVQRQNQLLNQQRMQQMSMQQKPSLFGNMMSQMGQMKSTPNRFNPDAYKFPTGQPNWQSAINQGGQPGMMQGIFSRMNMNPQEMGPRGEMGIMPQNGGYLPMQNQMAGPSNDMRQRLLQYAQGTMMPGSGMMQPMRRMY